MHAMHCKFAMQLGLAVGPVRVYPSHLAIRCVQQHQTAAMRCWRSQSLGLDQSAGRPLPGGRWLLVAGTCMDAWPVLKLTPGAKAQRS